MRCPWEGLYSLALERSLASRHGQPSVPSPRHGARPPCHQVRAAELGLAPRRPAGGDGHCDRHGQRGRPPGEAVSGHGGGGCGTGAGRAAEGRSGLAATMRGGRQRGCRDSLRPLARTASPAAFISPLGLNYSSPVITPGGRDYARDLKEGEGLPVDRHIARKLCNALLDVLDRLK